MTWQRQEDGMTVTVSLVKVDAIPASHADKAVGLWRLMYEDEKENATLFMRWDRHYIFGILPDQTPPAYGKLTHIVQKFN